MNPSSTYFETTSMSTKLLRCSLLVLALCATPFAARAQDPGLQRVMRGYIPPDQLVSFLPSTPFNTFLELLNPTMQRVTGKIVIDPESRVTAIGVPVQTTHFFDAFQFVLAQSGLTYRETDKYFIVEVQPPPDPMLASGTGLTGVAQGTVVGAPSTGGTGAAPALPATLNTRQVRINAVLFELNHTKSKEIGLDWTTVLSSQNSSSSGGSSGGSTGGSGASTDQNRVQFFLKSKELFSGMDKYIDSPDQINFASINSILRFAESSGLGETVASPSVSVQSGVKGSMQVGADVPLITRDFQGQSQTTMFKTGIIIDVTPTIITLPTADTLGAPTVDFIHMAVKVEKSGSRPTAAGLTIDRSTAETQVAVINGEQTVIGGLYSTDESYSRSGIPFLKDLPPWFFGLRYLFGKDLRSENRKELIIVLVAEISDPILERMARELPSNTLDSQRESVRQALERFNSRVADQHGQAIKYDVNK